MSLFQKCRHERVYTEATVRRCSSKQVFLTISQNLQNSNCTRDSFLIKRLWHRCFPLNFAKFLKTPFYIRTLPVAASVYGAIDFKISILQPYVREAWEYLYLLFQGKPIDKIKWYIKRMFEKYFSYFCPYRHPPWMTVSVKM